VLLTLNVIFGTRTEFIKGFTLMQFNVSEFLQSTDNMEIFWAFEFAPKIE